MPGYQDTIAAAAHHLRATVNSLPASAPKAEVREASERIIAALREAHYTLRDGYEIPAIED